MNLEYVKHRLIGTWLGDKLMTLRRGWTCFRRPHQLAIVEEHLAIDAAIARLVTADSNCIDVGCHLGSVLHTFVTLAPRGTHFAVEPIARKARWLRKKYPGVTVFEVCVSDAPGQATFYIQPSASGYSSLGKPSRAGSVQTVTMECRRLDDLLPPDHRVDFMKVDVEGAELQAFRGARHTLERCRPHLLFECTVYGSNESRRTPEAVYEFLHGECGYEIFLPRDWVRDGEPITARSFAHASEFPPVARNFLAVHPARRKTAGEVAVETGAVAA